MTFTVFYRFQPGEEAGGLANVSGGRKRGGTAPNRPRPLLWQVRVEKRDRFGRQNRLLGLQSAQFGQSHGKFSSFPSKQSSAMNYLSAIRVVDGIRSGRPSNVLFRRNGRPTVLFSLIISFSLKKRFLRFCLQCKHQFIFGASLIAN